MTSKENRPLRFPVEYLDDITEILTDLLPSREAAHTTATSLRDGQADEFIPELVWHLTTYRAPVDEAVELWEGMVQHHEALRQQLGRPTGMRVAAIDYFSNVLGRSAKPRAAHPELLEHLYQQATMDALTGLANRRFLRTRFKDELSRAARYQANFSQILFDVDNFKQINDTRGHDEGDRILLAVADHIRACIRDSDTAARWGGEEFTILMPETSKKAAAMVAERIRARVEKELSDEGVTLSGGVSCYPEDGEDEGTLFQAADRCLYRAKEEGKNRIELIQIDRRSIQRNAGQFPVTLSPVGADNCVLEAKTTDLSKTGFGFRHNQLLWVADEVTGTIKIQEKLRPFKGRIMHVETLGPDDYHVGVAFSDPAASDIPS